MSVDTQAPVPAHVPSTASSPSRTSPVVPPIDLRHMTSNSLLATPGELSANSGNRRASQHLGTVRKGSRSPASIPSSPTSVHSSSSAIFERDIEPMHVSPSTLALTPASKNPHRMPRSKNTETLEQSVPSVLDCAAAILTSMTSDDVDSISVIAPAPSVTGLFEQGLRSSRSGFTSPVGFRSRSPSPSPGATRTNNRNSLLLSIPGLSAGSPPSPTLSTTPLTATVHTNSATSAGNKRLSFIAYSDLLSSTPTATQPLSALTSPASSPSHIPGVAIPPDSATASSAYSGSGAVSLKNFGFGIGDDERAAIDDVGGEWEREGLGRGLQERLEALQTFGMA